jgi:hypothetical protein
VRDYADCCSQCARTSACHAFTYTKALSNYPGPNGSTSKKYVLYTLHTEIRLCYLCVVCL